MVNKIKVLLYLLIILSVNIKAQYDYSPGFQSGRPDEMEKLSFIEGDWNIDLFYTSDKKAESPNWIKYDSTFSSIKSIYDGSFYVEDSKGFPIKPAHEAKDYWQFITTFSYDRFNKIYRLSYIDNILGLLDIYEGFYSNGKFYMSNAITATYNNLGQNGTEDYMNNGIIIEKINSNTFSLTWVSASKNDSDGKEFSEINWVWSIKLVYKKKL